MTIAILAITILIIFLKAIADCDASFPGDGGEERNDNQAN